MRRPRLTIGRLMALVAVLGLVLGIGVLVKRSNDCRLKAEHHENEVAFTLLQIGHMKGHLDKVGAEALQRGKLQVEKRQARRFRAAQRRPWLAVPDDPD